MYNSCSSNKNIINFLQSQLQEIEPTDLRERAAPLRQPRVLQRVYT